MKTVFDRDAGLSKGIAQIPLQAGQSRQIPAGNAGPQHARTPDIRKGAHPLRGEAEARMSADDPAQGGLNVVDIGPWEVAKEMESQVDPFDGIDPNGVAKRVQRGERSGQR